MRLSYNWLKEFVDIDINPYQLKDVLTSCGLKVERVSRIDDLNDTVLEIEITSNRPDLLSMIGIGREVAAIVRKPLKLPETLEDNPGPDEVLTKTLAKIAIESNKCKRYTARIINDVRVSVSPRWLVHRLASMGLRTINNVVDITNFVMMEYGQPLHGFDYDKIKDGKIFVRLAQKGERIVTIDGVERNLDEETLVICDAERPLAIAGIMGGKDTEVTDATKRVLLESAYFDPVSVRKTARRLGISSESSYRFERGVDLMDVPLASLRAALLMKRIASGKPSKGIADRGKRDVTIKSIYLEIEKVNGLLGTRIKEGEIIRLLKA
ncbi:MAG: phenylalanine--tRNA ligase subunit beta, partial [Candidatus Omnitrophica bacterium]|nr:phenylalanine--tRNA ligase subunit beta [Candidatus Omnitrophota bacterium]